MRYKREIKLPQLEKSFLVAKVVLAIAPIICYLYITIKASANSVSFQKILYGEMETTILLINSMLNIYVAYLLHLAQRNLEKGKEFSSVMNGSFLILSQLLSRNMFGFVMLVFVSHQSLSYYKISLKEVKKTFTVKQLFFDAGGSIFVCLINCITLYATIQIM